MKTFKELLVEQLLLRQQLTEKIRKGREKDYIVTMTNKAGKEFARIDYPTEKKAREAIEAGKFFGSADMIFKLEKGNKSLKVQQTSYGKLSSTIRLIMADILRVYHTSYSVSQDAHIYRGITR